MEIADHLGTKNKSVVTRLLDSLEYRGFINRLRNRNRAIEVIRPIHRYQAFKYIRENEQFERLTPS